jgi:hypothetical protein
LIGAEITKAINEANETTVREKAVVDGKVLHVLPSKDVLPAAEASKAGIAGRARAAAAAAGSSKKNKNKKSKGKQS